MKHSQNVIPQPACGSLPSLSPQHGFGWGREGEEQKTPKKIPNTSGLCCVCVFGVPQGLVSQRLVLHPAGIKAGGSRTVPGVQVCHISSWILSVPGEGNRRDSEGTLQYPTEKGILHHLGFPVMLFLGLRLWGVSKIPANLHSPPCCPELHPCGEQGCSGGPGAFLFFIPGGEDRKAQNPLGMCCGGSPWKGKATAWDC